MTNDETLMQQALEALNHVNVQDRVQIITALRERLAHCDRCGKKLGGEGHIHTCSPQVQDPMPLFDDWNKDWQK